MFLKAINLSQAYLLLREREAAGVEPISKDLVDPEKVKWRDHVRYCTVPFRFHEYGTRYHHKCVMWYLHMFFIGDFNVDFITSRIRLPLSRLFLSRYHCWVPCTLYLVILSSSIFCYLLLPTDPHWNQRGSAKYGYGSRNCFSQQSGSRSGSELSESGSAWIHIHIQIRIRIEWIWIRNTAVTALFFVSDFSPSALWRGTKGCRCSHQHLRRDSYVYLYNSFSASPPFIFSEFEHIVTVTAVVFSVWFKQWQREGAYPVPVGEKERVCECVGLGAVSLLLQRESHVLNRPVQARTRQKCNVQIWDHKVIEN